ncbi:MAG: hypothetical protein ABWZ87_10005 [Aeromicrobium sp.]
MTSEPEHAVNDDPSSPDDGDMVSSAHRELAKLLAGYASLSRDYANAHESRLALLAMWTADVHVLQLLLLESGLDRAPDPSAQLASVGEAVTRSLSSVTVGEATPRQLIERSREAMVATFDASVHAMLVDRFLPLDHLDSLTGPAVGAAGGAVERRLDGRTREQLVADLEATAHDCVAVAGTMLAAADLDGALRQMHHADLASFEAFLLRTAMDSGDETLASVDLSWDLAARAFAEPPMHVVDPADVEATVDAWRDRLVVFGGWAQAARMRASFLRVPVA